MDTFLMVYFSTNASNSRDGRPFVAIAEGNRQGPARRSKSCLCRNNYDGRAFHCICVCERREQQESSHRAKGIIQISRLELTWSLFGLGQLVFSSPAGQTQKRLRGLRPFTHRLPRGQTILGQVQGSRRDGEAVHLPHEQAQEGGWSQMRFLTASEEGR